MKTDIFILCLVLLIITLSVFIYIDSLLVPFAKNQTVYAYILIILSLFALISYFIYSRENDKQD